MRDGMVEIRESYFKRADGTVHMRRYVDNDLVWEGPSSLVFIDFSVADAPWNLICKPATSLVKEAPKAMVKWSVPCTTL